MSGSEPVAFNPKTDFRYVMGEKGELVLVLFYGRISNREVGQIEEIETALKEKTQRILLLNFHDVTVIMPAAHQCLAKFQKAFRDDGKLIGICGLPPEIKMSLLQSGIIRESEIFNNIPDAWKSLSSKAQNQPAKPQEEEKEAA